MSKHSQGQNISGYDAMALLGFTDVSNDAPELEQPQTDLEQIGTRVVAARERAGFSGSALADRLGLSKDKISKVENGRRRISANELPSFADALGVTVRYLLGAEEPTRMALAHRLTAHASKLAPGEVPATYQRAVDLLRVEQTLAPQVELQEPRLSTAGASVRRYVETNLVDRPRNRAQAQRQGRRLANVVREALNLGSAEIRDLTALIEDNFAVDVALSPLGTGADGLCVHTSDSGLIVASTDFSEGHIRFTLAHELGHHILQDPREVIAENTHDMLAEGLTERRVQAFAAHLLMPGDGVRTVAAANGLSMDELRLKTERAQRGLGYLMRHYGVSLPALLFHLADLGLLTWDEAKNLKVGLSSSAVRRQERLSPDIPSLRAPLAETIVGTVRPPRRLLDAAVDAARAGIIATGTIAVLLEREDDDALFDEVMGDVDDHATYSATSPLPAG